MVLVRERENNSEISKRERTIVISVRERKKRRGKVDEI